MGGRAWQRFIPLLVRFGQLRHGTFFMTGDLRNRVWARLADTLPEAALARPLCRGRFFCGQGFA
jgi:hypothetical protein